MLIQLVGYLQCRFHIIPFGREEQEIEKKKKNEGKNEEGMKTVI